MNAFLDLTSLIFLVIAVVIFWRLRSVLGTRTGNEKPPFDPFAGRKAEVEPPPAGDNVVTLPREGRPDPREAMLARIDEAVPDGSANAGLKAIAAVDRDFDIDGFMSGASAAYEMIVSAFAAGDRAALKPLLSREVFDGFSGVIAEREGRGEKIDFTFVGIDEADVVDAGLEGGHSRTRWFGCRRRSAKGGPSDRCLDLCARGQIVRSELEARRYRRRGLTPSWPTLLPPPASSRLTSSIFPAGPTTTTPRLLRPSAVRRSGLPPSYPRRRGLARMVRRWPGKARLRSLSARVSMKRKPAPSSRRTSGLSASSRTRGKGS
jgi:hypothetical protein